MMHPHHVEGAGSAGPGPRLAALLALTLVAASCASAGGPRGERGERGPHAAASMPPGTPVAQTLQALEPLPAFTPAEFSARRDSLMRRMGHGVAILMGALPAAPGQQFRQDPDFYYLTGVETPDAVLVVNAGTRQVDLFLPQQTPEQVKQEGAWLTPGADAVRETGIDDVHPRSALDAMVQQATTGVDTIWTLHPEAPSPVAPSYDAATVAALAQLRRTLPGKALADLGPLLAELRWVKSPHEQAYLRRAGRIATLGMNEAIRSTRPGYFEWEVASAAAFVQHEMGAHAGAFAPTLAGGPNVNTLRYTRNDRRLRAEDLVLLHYGPEYGYYASDIARTWTANGQFSAEELPYYQTVELVRDSVIASMKPGVTVNQLLAIAQRIVRARGHQAVAWPTTRNYIGHFLGLSADDPTSAAALDRPMVPGVVFSVDPVIDMPSRHWLFRIEDTVLITPDGHQILTLNSPVSPTDLTALYLETGVVEWWKGQEGVGMGPVR